MRSNRSSRAQSLLNDLLDESRRHHTDNWNNLDKIRREILQAIDQADSSRGTSIREAFANIRTYCLELVMEGEKLNKSQRILSSLKCTTLRESAIKEAYGTTFEWIFSELVLEGRNDQASYNGSNKVVEYTGSQERQDLENLPL